MEKNINTNICAESVFEKIFQKHSKDLHNFLYYKYGSLLDPEDKVQEAFVKLWDKCADTTPEKAKSFLFTIANNSMLNAIKHEKVKLKYAQKPFLSTTNESPEFILEEKEYLDKYQKALSNLTEGQREVFLLNRIDKKKHQEIADLLGISRKAVEKRLYTALEKMRKEIKNIP